MNFNRIIIALVILFVSSCKEKKNNILKIEPPFKEIHLPQNKISIDPTISQVARFENGVSIEIPENTFIDSLGNVITEEVTLTIETYNSTAEIIASGIPMSYSDDDESGNFMSAGMFKLTGYTQSQKVNINKNKPITINYPSKVCGSFDFFHFKENRDNSGKWIKLSDNENKDVPDFTALDSFKLSFLTEEYLELEIITGINWKLATHYNNPNNINNRWVLDEKWSSIEISQPKYGLAEKILEERLNFDRYVSSDSYLFTKDRIITSNKPVTKIWNAKGELVNSIGKVTTTYQPVKVVEDTLLIVDRSDGDYIYNFNGDKLGKLPNKDGWKVRLDSTKSVIIYNEQGIEDNVYITHIDGNLIKKIHLKKDVNHLFKTGIFEHFILTPEDELFTNSLDGIDMYNLKGEKLLSKKGKYNSISYLMKNTLLIQDLDGTLIVWNYKTQNEIKSKKHYFNLNQRLVRKAWNFSRHFSVPNIPAVVINEAGTNTSKIWNYETNTITNLSFEISYLEENSLPDHLIVGYDSKNQIYHLYDLQNNEDVIKITDFGYNIYWDGTQYFMSVLSNNQKVLINNAKHSRLYNLQGNLIKDFKKYDSLIISSVFLENDLIATISEDGIYRQWNQNGAQLSSKKLPNKDYIYAWFHENNLTTYGKTFRSRNYYDYNGFLKLNAGRSWYSFTDSTTIYSIEDKNSFVLKSISELGENVYQLNIRTKDKEFITYIYLNESDLENINKYNTYKLNKVKQEKDRQEKELSLTRRFAISEFGIYNWDVIIDDTNSISFSAQFNFDVATEYNNVTVFLITELNGPAVIKYYQDSWRNFSINPKLKNKLIAILPNNKIAMFEEFDKLDYSRIKEDKTCVFDMKTYEKEVLSLSDLKNILD